jgi:hypothetical protein
MQAYQGYFEGGKFIPENDEVLPEHRRAIVMFVDDVQPNPSNEERWSAWDDFCAAILSSDEPVPEFERLNLSREIEL